MTQQENTTDFETKLLFGCLKEAYTTINPTLNKERRWQKINKECFPIYKKLNLGNGTCYQIGAFYFPDTHFTEFEVGCNADLLFFLAIEGRGAYAFNNKNWKAWQYVADKLGLLEVDARNVADWINVQVLNDDYIEQGRYEEQYI